MGLGDDWQKAVEKVKTMHVPPGEQPYLIRDLAWEAINYLRENDLVTVPPLAAETWGLQMMSPRRQLINPFFTGGNEISVSFPTDTMTHDQKLQSMRGNNIPFARATVHHELIPGHNLQFFMTSRYKPYRRLFSTPFWGEGWALYWEMVLYDRGFPKTPEDRVGFLVWRKHRLRESCFRSASTWAACARRSASTTWWRTSASIRTTRRPKCAAPSKRPSRSTRPPTCWAACNSAVCEPNWSIPAG